LVLGILLSATGAAPTRQVALHVVIALSVFGYSWVAPFFSAHQQAKRSPNLQGTVSYPFNDLGYVSQAPHSRAEFKWSGLVKWKEGKHCFAIYMNPKIANIIPKRFFQSSSDVEAVRGFLQSAGSNNLRT
jgi:hypothetical protein